MHIFQDLVLKRGFDTYYITYLGSDSGSSEFYGFIAGEELALEDGLQTTNNLSDEFETDDPDSALRRKFRKFNHISHQELLLLDVLKKIPMKLDLLFILTRVFIILEDTL